MKVSDVGSLVWDPIGKDYGIVMRNWQDAGDDAPVGYWEMYWPNGSIGWMHYTDLRLLQ